jgi:hypothetical protein
MMPCIIFLKDEFVTEMVASVFFVNATKLYQFSSTQCLPESGINRYHNAEKR